MLALSCKTTLVLEVSIFDVWKHQCFHITRQYCSTCAVVWCVRRLVHVGRVASVGPDGGIKKETTIKWSPLSLPVEMGRQGIPVCIKVKTTTLGISALSIMT